MELGALARPVPQNLEQALAEAVSAGGTLARRLKLFAEYLASLAPDYAATYGTLIARLSAAEGGASAPQVGDLLPDMMLADSAGRLRTLTELLRAGPVVISFKRGRWCEFCRIEIDALAKAYPVIKALGAEVVSITPEIAPEFPTTDHSRGAPFPLLTDVDCGYALALGVAMPLDKQLVDMLQRDGINLAESHAGSAFILPLPATFIVAPDRRVVARFVSPDFRLRMETSDVLEALKDLARNKSRS